jgi:ankyrin repeat protein
MARWLGLALLGAMVLGCGGADAPPPREDAELRPIDQRLLDAAYENDVAAARRLVADGADVDAKDSFNGTGLIRAAERGHTRVIARLLETEIELDHVNRLGWTALLEAIILGEGGAAHTRTVRLLVDAGADVDIADESGTTPLAHARRMGFEAIERILADAGATG